MELLTNRWFKSFIFTLIGILSGLGYFIYKDGGLVLNNDALMTILFSGLIGFFLSFPFPSFF